MAMAWDKVIPPEIVANIKRELLKKDAFYLRVDQRKKSAKGDAYREKIKIRYQGGFISEDGTRFYDQTRKRWIKIERAILEEKILFDLSKITKSQLFGHLQDKEHGFMFQLMEVLDGFDPESEGKKPLKARLKGLTLWQKQGGVSRNFVDPFFHSVLDQMTAKLTLKAQEFIKKHG